MVTLCRKEQKIGTAIRASTPWGNEAEIFIIAILGEENFLQERLGDNFRGKCTFLGGIGEEFHVKLRNLESMTKKIGGRESHTEKCNLQNFSWQSKK